MRTVRDSEGNEYLLVKQSSESSLVRDPATGTERYRSNDELTTVEGESALELAASGVPEPVRRVLRAVHSDESLGLLVELVDGGPVAVRELLDTVDLCESDLFGLVSEFRAAGLVEECEVGGERGYDATATAHEAVTTLRS